MGSYSRMRDLAWLAKRTSKGRRDWHVADVAEYLDRALRQSGFRIFPMVTTRARRCVIDGP